MAQQRVCCELSGLLEPSGLLGLPMPQPLSCERRWHIMHSRRGCVTLPCVTLYCQRSAVVVLYEHTSRVCWWLTTNPNGFSQVKELETENGRLHRQVASLEAAAAEQGKSHATLETQASSSVTSHQRIDQCIGAVQRMLTLVEGVHKSKHGLVQLDEATAALATAEEQLGSLKALHGRQKLQLDGAERGASEVQQQRDALAKERCAAWPDQ
jgi:hypothetical protein